MGFNSGFKGFKQVLLRYVAACNGNKDPCNVLRIVLTRMGPKRKEYRLMVGN